MHTPLVAGWRCVVCGAHVDIAAPLAWRCPNSTADDRHHELELVQAEAPFALDDSADQPFVMFQRYLAWDAFAASCGLTEAARRAVITDLDQQVAGVAGTGFRVTPFERANELSAALGFTERGGVWLKDETHNVAGSHKARHLFTILLHLITVELTGRAPWPADQRPPLAIASCGNAALAASTLAAAVQWPIRVFVPPSANPSVVTRLAELGATVVPCPRLLTDPAGDPCVHRFREAVADGAVPFSVQGPENAWCLDGGRTIGWELALQAALHERRLDRVFVQVGGGAFAACTAAGLAAAGRLPRLHAVQTEACAPLSRAWTHAQTLGVGAAARHWSACMWPWEHVGASAADGILDDETYDWLPVVEAMSDGHGTPVVATEAQVLQAHQLVRDLTQLDASPTGTAGLAGLLAIRGEVGADETVAVIVSGIRR